LTYHPPSLDLVMGGLFSRGRTDNVFNGQKLEVVVVGGGGAGTMFVRSLLRKLDPARYTLTLINARPFSVFLPTTIRMAVTEEGKLEDKVILPFDKLLRGVGTLKVGTAVAIEEPAPGKGGHVVLHGGERVHYDALILSPGTRLDNPLDYPNTEEEITRYIDGWRQKFREAEHIVMAGGGPVNVELAGEVKEYWPEKKVTIVQSRELPFNDVYANNFRKQILKECKISGIDFVFKDYLDDAEPKEGYVTTRNGHTIRADLVITAHGGKPNTDFIKSLGEDVVTVHGLVRTNPTLEVPGHPGVFCIGDVVDNPERNRLGKYPRHVNVVVPNILARLKGGEPAKKYRGSVETLRVSIGKDRGVTYFGVFGGFVLASWFTRQAQSRDLIISKGLRVMGYK